MRIKKHQHLLLRCRDGNRPDCFDNPNLIFPDVFFVRLVIFPPENSQIFSTLFSNSTRTVEKFEVIINYSEAKKYEDKTLL